jgi:hypothetical protein
MLEETRQPRLTLEPLDDYIVVEPMRRGELIARVHD